MGAGNGEGEGERRAFISRIGTFFLLLAVAVLVLFIASDVGETTHFQYFFLALLLFGISFFLKRAGAAPRPPGKRFEALRRARQKQREAKEKKAAGKNKK